MFRFRLVPDDTHIPFMKARFIGVALFGLFAMVSSVLFFYPGLNYGIDFRGGIVIEIRTPEAADFAALRSRLGDIGLGQVALQAFGSPRDVLIRLERQEGPEEAQQQAIKKVQAELADRFPGTEVRRVEAVGGAVSEELIESGLMAVGLGLLAMLGYIWFRFEWQFGLGAFVTLILDVLWLIGFFAVTQLQFTLTSVAAALTIIGYSINDKVVVYDRMRENLRLYKKKPLRELIDQSINQTLNRTLGTSLTTLLAAVPLAIYGGSALQSFAWPLVFGIIFGTLSSIFIAAPILLFLGEQRLRRGSPDDAAEDTGGS